MLSPLAQVDIPGVKFFTADQVLSPYVYVFYASYIVAFVFTPVLRTVAGYYRIIDQPDSARKIHKVPVAYLGGVAVFLGWLCGLAITQFLSRHRLDAGMPGHLIVNFSIIVGACVIVFLGLWDDIFGVSPRVKIAGQAFAGAALLYQGIGTQSAWVLLRPLLQRLHLIFPDMPLIGQEHWIVAVLSAALVMFIVVACCNATNLMDGMDGLCGGVTSIVAAGFLFLAVNMAMRSGALNANEDGLRVAIALGLMGAVLGFVPFNFNPASIFLGDTGSMFIGYVCAVMIILFMPPDQLVNWALAATIVFALPVLDTALAFTRRWVNGRPIFSADRFHLHHQLLARGFSVKQTVMISYALAVGFAVLGALVVYMRVRYAVALYIVAFGSIVVAAYKMGMIHELTPGSERKPRPLRKKNTESLIIEVTQPFEIDHPFEAGRRAESPAPTTAGRPITPR